MTADRKWVQTNLGFDPVAKPPPANTYAFAAAAASAKPEDFQREIIDFDSEAPSGREFLAFSTATGRWSSICSAITCWASIAAA